MSSSKAFLFLAAAALASTAASAGHNGSPLKSMNHPPIQELKVKKEVFISGNGDSTSIAPFTFTNLDSGSVLSCTRTPCTISATAQVQYEPGATGGGWAICLLVDGVDIECQYLGQADDTFFHSGSVQGSVSAAIGNHTVQTQLYVEQNNSTYQYFAMTYAANQ
jgi:hypothetical protein